MRKVANNKQHYILLAYIFKQSKYIKSDDERCFDLKNLKLLMNHDIDNIDV